MQRGGDATIDANDLTHRRGGGTAADNDDGGVAAEGGDAGAVEDAGGD